MKILLVFLALIAQKSTGTSKTLVHANAVSITASVAPDWKEGLARFRTALLTGDKATVEWFIDFPILDPGNDIWLVADLKYASTIDPKKIVPFAKPDFDKHYSSIFSNDFRKTLEKIDIEKLAKHSTAETAELKIADPATSQMKAKYSAAAGAITLSLITKSPAFGQFTIDYHFKILKTGGLRFVEATFVL